MKPRLIAAMMLSGLSLMTKVRELGMLRALLVGGWLSVESAALFLEIEHDGPARLKKQNKMSYEEAKAIAKMACEGIGFLDDNICPVVNDLP